MHTLTLATSVEIGQLQPTAAVLPVGSFEQHGGHLPLTTDTLVACAIANAIAEQYRLFLLPPITISCSHEHATWPGTVSISSSTLIAVVNDISRSLHQAGIEKMILVNGHGGNYVLSNIVQEANVTGPRLTLYPGRTEWEIARNEAGLETSAHNDMHAGEIETSILLYTHPDAVGDHTNADVQAVPRPHLLIHGVGGYTKSGAIGSPSLATAVKGQNVLGSLTRSFQSHLAALRIAH